MALKSIKPQKKTKYQPFYVIPFILLLIIFPVLFLSITISNPLTNTTWYTTQAFLNDMFLVIKKYALYVITAIMCMIFLFDINLNYKNTGLSKKDYLHFIPLGFYIILVVLSTCFSIMPSLSTSGMPDLQEPLFVLLGYTIICFYSYWFFTQTNRYKQVFFFLYIGIALAGIFCFLQFIGIDPIRLAFPTATLTFQNSYIYGTFYNSNYAGGYAAMMLPVTIFLFCYGLLEAKHRFLHIIISIILSLLLLLTLIGSNSAGGMIGISVALLLGVLLTLFKHFHLSFKHTLITLACIFVFTIIGSITSLSIMNINHTADEKSLEAIYTNDTNLEFHYNNHILFITAQTDESDFYLNCTDENNKKIDTYISDEAFYFSDARFTDVHITPLMFSDLNNLVGFTISLKDSGWNFTNATDGTYYFITPNGSLVKLTSDTSAPYALCNNIPELFSERGYIWSRTLPLMENTLFLGSGPDTFGLKFPNDDYVNAYRNNYYNILVIKPHNFFLQMIVQTGFLSFLAFTVFYIWYFVSSLRFIFAGTRYTPASLLCLFLLLGTISYLVTGIVNDSCIAVTPFFWFMLGAGFSIVHNSNFIKC